VAVRARQPSPGEPQKRRAQFCAKLLGYTIVLGFLTAAVIGIPFPGLWKGVFVPALTLGMYLFLVLTIWFFSRMLWFKVKARHYAALVKMRSEDR
jgi:hypothetical protein